MEAGRQRQFRIHHCLGRGGYGEVYRATMLSPGGIEADVALKLLRLDVEPGGEAARRLRDEGRLLAALRHPAILAVHDMALLEGRVGLVTEFVEGQDLSSLIGCGGLPSRALIQATGMVAEALDVAWRTESSEGDPLHLIHRDVKPSNIRIGRHGEVKLLDFGIARSVTDGVDREARTGTGSAVGSLAYMAPERFTRAPAGPAADVYGLGCTLFEGLAGERLFPDVVPVEMFRLAADAAAHTRHVHRATGKLDVSGRVVALVEAMLSHDPAARPDAAEVAHTCDGLVDALEGDTLRRWARARAWPDPDPVPGHFDGRTITEGTLSTLGATGSGSTSLPSETYNFELPPPALRRSWVRPALGLGAALIAVALILPVAVDPGAERAAGSTPAPVPVADPIPAPVPVADPIPVPVPDPVLVPDPDPVLRIEPKPAVPDPVPDPVEAVDPQDDVVLVLPPVTHGQVRLATPGVDVELRGPGVSYTVGRVPVGRYELYADFGFGMRPQGHFVDVVEARPLTIVCNTLRHGCDAQD